ERTERLGELFRRAPSFMAVLRGPDHVFELANAAYHAMVGQRELIGKSLADALPELRAQGVLPLLDRVFTTGEPHVGTGVPLRLQREAGAPDEERYLDFVFEPLVAQD